MVFLYIYHKPYNICGNLTTSIITVYAVDNLVLHIIFNYLCHLYSRKKEVKLNLELSRLPQGSNTLSPTSASKTLASSPLSSTTTTTTATTTTTTTTSPIPVNQIRR